MSPTSISYHIPISDRVRKGIFHIGIVVVLLGVGISLFAELIYGQRAPYFFCGLYTSILGIIVAVAGILKGKKPKKPMDKGRPEEIEPDFERGDSDHMTQGWRP